MKTHSTLNFLYSDSVCEYSFNESYAALGAFRRYTGHGFVVFHTVEEVLYLGGVAVCARNVYTHIFAYLTGSGRELLTNEAVKAAYLGT